MTRRKTAFLFSGQGSQYYGMGRELYESNAVFRDRLLQLDDVFSHAFAELAGRPSHGVLGELYRPDRTRADRFDELRYTHPAILMVELALFAALRAEGVEPDCILGASLGGFAAATAAGVMEVEELARSIAAQVQAVERFCPRGAMVAVFCTEAQRDEDAVLRDHTVLAAVNSDRHIVLSVLPEGIEPVESRLSALGLLFQRLPVSYPFHSPWMDAAAGPFHDSVRTLPARTPLYPLLSCETAEPLHRVDGAALWRMVRTPIRFRDAVRALERSEHGWLYVDLGPSGTLANFARQSRAAGSRSEAVAVLDPFAPAADGVQRARRAHAAPAQRAMAATQSHSEAGNMRAYVFPGQGSQARGMGEALFAEFPAEVARADAILGYSVARLCVDDPERRLDNTEFTQPALFVVNALSFMRHMRAGGEAPDFFAGHSLGEYNALHAAGVFDLETGVRLVQKRARLMAGATGGGMAAVLGLDEAAVAGVLSAARHPGVVVANYNGAGQFIISGARDAVERTRDDMTAAGAQHFLPLRVSGAFHSHHMEPARREFEEFLRGIDFAAPSVPVIANVTGRPYPRGEVARLLAEQLTAPVRWDHTVHFLLSQGEVDVEEVGPGRVLTKLVAKMRTSGPRPDLAIRLPRDLYRGPTEAPPAAPPAAPPTLTAAPAAPPAPAAPAASPAHTAPAASPAYTAPAAHPAPATAPRFSAERLGSAAFREAYGTRYAYVCGSMFRGTASEELVVEAARAGVLAFFGTGGLPLERTAQAIASIRAQLPAGAPFGMNLVHDPTFGSVEDDAVELFLKEGVANLEASAFIQVTPALVRFRLAGAARGADGRARAARRVMAKVSRPEVAEAFLAPAPERIVRRLVELGQLTPAEAALAGELPMADDLCVEADSGGHTDRANPLVLLPTIQRLRDRVMERHGFAARVRVGAAGGIGTPEAAAAVFVLGADFILTGSINLCTVESGMSGVVKDMLQEINIQDTDYAPAGDMFELGAQVQVLKRGVFFPARARKLYDLYRRHESLEEIDPATRAQIEERYFHKSFDEVWRETREYFAARDPREIEKAEQNPRQKMALVFRWYFGRSQRLAMSGTEEGRVDFQVHCGPALGAFNQWVKGTPLEPWRSRRVGEVARRLMDETARCLDARMAELGS